MFKYCSLYSSSSGNSFFVQSNNTNLLIDVGVSTKKVETALKKINIDINNIDAILITHEHTDHTKGISTLSTKYSIPVYATEKTWEVLPDISNKISSKNKKCFNISKYFSIGDIKIFAFNIPHDAVNPCGFNLYHEDKKISIVTDIGYVSDKLISNLKQSSCILLESNYDPDVLKYSSYPYTLKQRIISNKGHLSNNEAAKALSHLYNFGLRQALLVHLSQENNFPELAYETIKNEIPNCENLSIDIAPKNEPTKLFEVC